MSQATRNAPNDSSSYADEGGNQHALRRNAPNDSSSYGSRSAADQLERDPSISKVEISKLSGVAVPPDTAPDPPSDARARTAFPSRDAVLAYLMTAAIRDDEKPLEAIRRNQRQSSEVLAYTWRPRGPSSALIRVSAPPFWGGSSSRSDPPVDRCTNTARGRRAVSSVAVTPVGSAGRGRGSADSEDVPT